MLLKDKNRLDYMDIMRGLGIIIMVMGHVGFGQRFDHFIHGFHMQMFFFISGFFFRSKPLEELKTFDFISGKARRLLLPYCIWGGFYYIIWVRRNWNNRSLEPLMHLLFDNTVGLPITGALWFLTALFLAEIIYFILNHYFHNPKTRTIMIIIVAFIGNVATRAIPFRLPYSMDAAFVGVGLFHVGYLFKIYFYERWISNWENSKKMKNILVTIGAGIIISLLIFQNGMINMRLGWYANILLFWINSIGATLVGLNISFWISKCQNKIILVLVSLIRRIGRNSMVYLCLNQFVIMKVWDSIILLDNKLDFISIEGYVFSITVFLSSMIILLIGDVVICDTKLKFIVGQ